LVSKSIATVINEQLIREKALSSTGTLEGMKALWPTSQIRLASKSFLATKLTILINIQAFYLGTTYIAITWNASGFRIGNMKSMWHHLAYLWLSCGYDADSVFSFLM
jgi:hypothetical protein